MHKYLYLIYGSKARALSLTAAAIRAFWLGREVAERVKIRQKDQIHEPLIKRKSLRNLK